MKNYTLSFAAALGHKPVHPERTAYRSVGRGAFDGDKVYQVWTNRVAMARSIRMQEKRAAEPMDWHACQKLQDGEGY